MAGHDGAAPPRRWLRRGLWAGLSLLLLAALAGALALPGVANRLALPWAPNAPQGPVPAPAATESTILGPDAAAARPSPDGLAAAITDAAEDPALGELSGSVVDPADGTVLWEREADTPRTPASASKVLTAAAALLSLKPTDRLATRVVEGAEQGEVVLVGGGDPTLSLAADPTEGSYPNAATLDALAEQVLEATGGEVDTVAVDLSAYTGDEVASGWSEDDAPSTYAAPIVPVMAEGGRADGSDPQSMRFENPAGEVLAELAERLEAEPAEPRVVDADEGVEADEAEQGAEVLGEVHSAPLDGLLAPVLADSDNVLAEALARWVAEAAGGQPSFDGAAEATLQTLEDAGFDTEGAALDDGSGLSRETEIPARLLSEILAAAAAPAGADPRTPQLRPLLEALPVAGGDGTLAERYDQEPARDGQGWVRAKTGTLSEVNTLTGVVLDQDGRVLSFTFISHDSEVRAARDALDELSAELRACGCR